MMNLNYTSISGAAVPILEWLAPVLSLVLWVGIGMAVLGLMFALIGGSRGGSGGSGGRRVSQRSVIGSVNLSLFGARQRVRKQRNTIGVVEVSRREPEAKNGSADLDFVRRWG